MARSTYSTSLPPNKPKVHSLVVAITRDVRTGLLTHGERLPGTRALAARLGISRGAVVRAYDDLIAQGWLVATPGSGVVVCPDIPDPLPRPNTHTATLGFALPSAAPSPRLLSQHLSARFQLLGGHPDLRLLPLTELARAYRRVLRGRGRRLVAYGDPRGEPRLRVALTTWLASTRGVRPEDGELLVTRGSQMALYLTAHTLFRPGDTVAIERLGYPPAWRAFESAGATLLPINVDDHGLRVDQIPPTVRAVYLTPHHQYPTGVTLSADRRIHLLHWAATHGVAIIEDDYDHEYHYDGPPIAPLVAADTHGVVISIGTLSKAFAPGIRVGFVVAPAPLIDRFVALRAVIDRQGDRVVEQAVAELLEDGTLARHLWRTRRTYANRRDALCVALHNHLPGVHPHVRPGGLALWCDVPNVDLSAWTARCLANSVYFEVGGRYTLDNMPIPHVRLGFAGHTEEELDEAVQRMAAVW